MQASSNCLSDSPNQVTAKILFIFVRVHNYTFDGSNNNTENKMFTITHDGNDNVYNYSRK